MRLTDELGGVCVQAKEVGRAFDDRQLVLGELRQAVANDLLHLIWAVAFIDGILPPEK